MTPDPLAARVHAIAERFYNSNLGAGQRGYRICRFCHGMASWDAAPQEPSHVFAHGADCPVAALESIASQLRAEQ